MHRVLSSHGEAEMGEQLARALGRILIVMDHGGSSTRVYAWEAMKEFCQQYRGNDHNEKRESKLGRYIANIGRRA